MKVQLLHPFSAKAIGLNEEDLYFSHSQPHEKALLKLQSEGYKVSIEYFTGNVLPYSKEIKGIKKHFWPISNFYKAKHVWRRQHSFFHYLINVFKPSDVTIINMSGHGSKYIFKLAKLLKNKQKPYIAMIGGLNMSTQGAALRYYQEAHHIIVHTTAQKNDLLSYVGFKNLDIRVLPLGVDTTIFKPFEGRNSDCISLLYVGRISRLKQIEFAIKATSYLIVNQNKHVVLQIVGPKSDTDYYNELVKLISDLNISKSVIFKENLEQVKLIPFYQMADLLLLPSAHESFGMVMVEAMSCGTPVAALKGAGGPDEIIENGINGILSTPENYNNAILNYFKNKEQQLEIAKNARAKVLKEYSIEATFQVLKSSVEDALK